MDGFVRNVLNRTVADQRCAPPRWNTRARAEQAPGPARPARPASVPPNRPGSLRGTRPRLSACVCAPAHHHTHAHGARHRRCSAEHRRSAGGAVSSAYARAETVRARPRAPGVVNARAPDVDTYPTRIASGRRGIRGVAGRVFGPGGRARLPPSENFLKKVSFRLSGITFRTPSIPYVRNGRTARRSPGAGSKEPPERTERTIARSAVRTVTAATRLSAAGPHAPGLGQADRPGRGLLESELSALAAGAGVTRGADRLRTPGDSG